MKIFVNTDNQTNRHSILPTEPQDINSNSPDSSSIPDYLNTQQAAEYLQVSTQWLEIKRVKGAGPPFYKIGRLVRYSKEDLDEWVRGQRRINTVEIK